MIKGILFDIRSIILVDGVSIPTLTIKALKEIKDKGIIGSIYIDEFNGNANSILNILNEYVDEFYLLKDHDIEGFNIKKCRKEELIDIFALDKGINKDEIVVVGEFNNDYVFDDHLLTINTMFDQSSNKWWKKELNRKKEDGGIYDILIDIGLLDKKIYNPKIFFFDIDHTVFDHFSNFVREKTYEALYKLKEKGYRLCINTSRSQEEMFNVPKKLIDMMDCVILLSGAYIIKDGETIITYMDEKESKEMIEYLDQKNLTYRYCTDDGGGYINRNDADKENIFYSLYDMIPPIKKYEGEKLLQILFYDNGSIREEVKDMVKQSEFSYLRLGAELYPKHTNKGYALEKVARLYGYNIEATCAFGDGDNDCTMLDKAGLGIAMGNGSILCKQSADYITDNIDDEGLYNALVYFGIIK